MYCNVQCSYRVHNIYQECSLNVGIRQPFVAICSCPNVNPSPTDVSWTLFLGRCIPWNFEDVSLRDCIDCKDMMRIMRSMCRVRRAKPSQVSACSIYDHSQPVHRKKRFTSFLSPAGMSPTKLPLGRNNSVMTSLFPPRESLVVTSRLGRETREPFFTVYASRVRKHRSGMLHPLDTLSKARIVLGKIFGNNSVRDRM
jgi:hypothetical protein